MVHTDVQNNQVDWIWTTPLDDKRWTATYSLVSGKLPKAMIDEITRASVWTWACGETPPNTTAVVSLRWRP